MKRLTLNETWKLCLAMWKWIAKEHKKNRTTSVGTLKYEWLIEHGYTGVEGNCFFCEYVIRHSSDEYLFDCALCPASKVDSSFSCHVTEYHYLRHPIAFYNKLVSLNRKRKKK